jgi:PTS system mannose-specific IID component
MTAPSSRGLPVPSATRGAMLLRLLAVQGSWNYETLLGNGIAFCIEPALRRLPGGRGGEAYRAALARQGEYFNAHPYLAAVAVGALARAELDGEDPARIRRFRTALCGPLGSVGDRLVWASFLPGCSFVALLVFALGGGPLLVMVTFLALYNTGHLALLLWGLHVGLRQGLRVAQSLGAPLLRRAPHDIGRVVAVLAGLALPLAMSRVLSPHGVLLGAVVAAVAVGGALLARIYGRGEGWKASMLLLAAFVIYSVAR